MNTREKVQVTKGELHGMLRLLREAQPYVEYVTGRAALSKSIDQCVDEMRPRLRVPGPREIERDELLARVKELMVVTKMPAGVEGGLDENETRLVSAVIETLQRVAKIVDQETVT